MNYIRIGLFWGEAMMSRLAFFFVSILVVTAVLTFITSAFFTITEVVIEGNRYFLADELLLMSGVKTGTNLFSIKAQEISSNLLTHPRVLEVDVKKNYPSQVEIVVREREPAIMLPFGGSFLELGHDGVVMSVYDNLGHKPLPVVTGANPVYTDIGEPLSSKALDVALRIINDLDKGFLEELSEVYVGNLSDIRLYTEDGITVLIGDFEFSKLEVINSFFIEHKAEWEGIVSIDLRVPNKMSVKRE